MGIWPSEVLRRYKSWDMDVVWMYRYNYVKLRAEAKHQEEMDKKNKEMESR